MDSEFEYSKIYIVSVEVGNNKFKQHTQNITYMFSQLKLFLYLAKKENVYIKNW